MQEDWDEDERCCEYCGKTLERREDERQDQFLNRRYCCKSCAAKDRPLPKKKKTQINIFIPKRGQDESYSRGYRF